MHPSKFINHALKHNCRIIDNDNRTMVWLTNRNQTAQYFVNSAKWMTLRHANFACMKLGIELMTEKDCED